MLFIFSENEYRLFFNTWRRFVFLGFNRWRKCNTLKPIVHTPGIKWYKLVYLLITVSLVAGSFFLFSEF